MVGNRYVTEASFVVAVSLPKQPDCLPCTGLSITDLVSVRDVFLQE